MKAETCREQALKTVIRDLSAGLKAEAPLPALFDRLLMANQRLWRWWDLAWRALRRLAPGLSQDKRPGERPLVAVDLLPMLPGGANGGAKPFTLGLLRAMAELAPDWTFVLVANPATMEELRALEGPNLKVIPAKRAWQAKPPAKLLGRKIDVWFCPFTRPYFQRPDIPMVSVIYDLQYHYYPGFFSEAERRGRDQTFKLAASRASRLACISDFVRQTVLEYGNVAADKVRTIHIRLPERLETPPDQAITAVLAKFGLEKDGYLIYPANFWPHKNHKVLLTAFGIHRASHPGSRLKLVLTGADTGLAPEIKEAAQTMGLGAWVIFTGFVSDQDLAGLTVGAKALIFPSLFEGYGMPVAEAMSLGRPVLCANLTSLPEVGGEAVLYFDPRQPDDVAQSMTRLESEPGLAENLAQAGRVRAASLGGPADMAREYLELLDEALRGLGSQSAAVTGLSPEGVAPEVFAAFGPASDRQWLEAEFSLDGGADPVQWQAYLNGKLLGPRQTLRPGAVLSIRCLAPAYGGCLELRFTGPSPVPGLACRKLCLSGSRGTFDLTGEGPCPA